jgi:hypothetical protein
MAVYDISSYAGNRSFAKAMVRFRSNFEYRTQKAEEKHKFKEGFKKWRKAK